MASPLGGAASSRFAPIKVLPRVRCALHRVRRARQSVFAHLLKSLPSKKILCGAPPGNSGFAQAVLSKPKAQPHGTGAPSRPARHGRRSTERAGLSQQVLEQPPSFSLEVVSWS